MAYFILEKPGRDIPTLDRSWLVSTKNSNVTILAAIRYEDADEIWEKMPKGRIVKMRDPEHSLWSRRRKISKEEATLILFGTI